MDFKNEFSLLLKARYPYLYISTFEEDRLEYTIRNCVKLQKNSSIYTWDFVEGYTNNPNDKGFAKRNPLQALELVEKLTVETSAVFILKDFNKFMGDIGVSRKLRNLSRVLKIQPKMIIILASDVTIPNELRDIMTVIEFQLPTSEEIKTELERLFKSLNQSLDDALFDTIVKSCQGLSLERIRRALSRILANYKVIDERSILLILKEKRQIISQTEILEYCSSDESISDIGGLQNLKTWLNNRSQSFSQKAINYGLPSPRGLLLIGIQGTGKSLTAKAISHDWKLPLLRLDFGRLFGGVVGESESRVRQMIQIVEAVSPCILWVDEIDKVFGQMESKGDSGTSNRVLGTFITWLSEKNSQVFIVATANNFKALPLELIRKGRFDEIFFVGLPNKDERQKIFKVHLSKFRPESFENYDLNLLSELTNNFSGAEIRQSIIEGMHFAFTEDREFTTNDICLGIDQTIPLAQIDKEQIQEMQEWALSGRVRLASSI